MKNRTMLLDTPSRINRRGYKSFKTNQNSRVTFVELTKKKPKKISKEKKYNNITYILGQVLVGAFMCKSRVYTLAVSLA